MRLLEVFLLLELKDRLTHIAQVMGEKIYKRFMKHMDDAGQAGLPREWREAIFDGGPLSGEEGGSSTNSGAEWIVEWFSQQDPSPNKKYTDWIIRQWLSETLWLEDASKMKGILETFEAHKKNLKKMDISDDTYAPPPERRGDINAWTDYRILARILRPLTGTQAAGEKVLNFIKKPEIQNLMHHPVPDPVIAFNSEDGEFDLEEIKYAHMDRGVEGDDIGDEFDTMDWYDFMQTETEATTAIKLIYKSDRLAILQPNTRAAACELGKGTEWCTSSTESENYFWTYAPDGPLYVILTDKMGKFQFHFESGQFANVHDEMLSNEERVELIKAYPELTEIFGDEAMDASQMWLVNGAEWDIDKVFEYMNSEGYSKDALQHAIKLWDGTAPEETLAVLEKWVREDVPESAFAYVRNPTVKDYTDSIVAVLEMGEEQGYANRNMLNILRHARDGGVKLPDEAIGLAIKGDSRAIKHASIEQLKKHPEWVFEASEGDDTWLRLSAAYVNNLPADWQPNHDYLADPVNEYIMEVFRDHPNGPKALAKLTERQPKLVRYYLDYFGTDPWKRAYMYANAALGTTQNAGHAIAENDTMQQLAKTIAERDMPNLDLTALITYLLNNGIMHAGTFHAIEKAMGGELPIEIQQAILKKNPAFITHMQNPHTRLEYEAHRDLGAGGRAFRDKQARQWKAENAAAKAHTDAGGDPFDFEWDGKVAESITEGVSSILYHVSQIHNVRDMLTDNSIRLTPNFGTQAERGHEPEGKIYYLSTARSKTGSYGYPVSKHQKQSAMVVFDGQALMAAGYTGKAMDYWGPDFRALGKDEMEDRIFSKKPAIPNASKYIKEIHILFDEDDTDHRTPFQARVVKDLGYKAKRLGIPLYIYTDQQAFGLLNKAKSLPVTSVASDADRLPLPDTDVEPRGYRGGPARNNFGGWIELLKTDDKSKLSKDGKYALYRAGYMDTNLGVDADIHNARSDRGRAHLDKFLAVLHQFNIKSSTELITYVNNKFRN